MLNQYCRNCGKAVPNGAYACLSCGIPPMVGVDFCNNCGAACHKEAVICVKCGIYFENNRIGTSNSQTISQNVAPQNAATQNSASDIFRITTAPKSWLAESILVTLFCCLPFGIVGIVNASKVESRFYAGDTDGALRASQEAKRWTVISFWVGIGITVLYLLVIALGSSYDNSY